MSLEQALRERRSIRSFTSRAVPRPLLEELVALAAWAPSASNRQDWRFTVVLEADLRQGLVEAVDRSWQAATAAESGVNEGLRGYMGHFSAFREAPVLIAVDAKRPPAFLSELLGARAERIAGGVSSAAMAIQNLLLAARGRGLGTCVFSGCVAAEEEIGRLLGFPRHRSLVAMVALGWPDEQPEAPPRRPLEEILSFR